MKNYVFISPQFFTKKNWEGLQLQNGFDKSYGYRMYKTRRKFYENCRTKQYEVAHLLGRSEIYAKPQLASFFLFPGNELSADAAIGWTCFLEYQKQCEKLGNQPSAQIETHLKNHFVGLFFGAKVMQKLSKAIAETLNVKLALEAMSRHPELKEVETYRVLTCNLMDPTLYSSIEQTLRWTILYDDVLPDSMKNELNPGVRELFDLIRKINAPILFELKNTAESEFLLLGKQWAVKILKTLSYSYEIQEMGLAEIKSFGEKEENPVMPVTIEESKDPSSSLLPYIDKDEIETVLGTGKMDIMKNLVNDLYHAAETPKSWEEPKPDRISFSINDPFKEVSAYQGELQECDYFEMEAENGQILAAEVLEESLPVSEDQRAIEAIQFQAEPITEALNKILYQNDIKTIAFTTSNNARNFQNNRLPLYKVDDRIYKKVIPDHRTSKGKPIIALVVDSSGSMKGAPLECTKIIAAAWSMRTDMKLLAASYTTSSSPQGDRAIVRWINHPKNTKDASKEECLGRIASVSEMSLGGNKDAAAFYKILSEAAKMASPMDKIYLVHLTDTGFFKSFTNSGESASGEIDTVVNYFKQRIFKKRLHITLVALANSATSYNTVDELCKIPSNLLQDYIGIAELINKTIGETISKTFK